MIGFVAQRRGFGRRNLTQPILNSGLQENNDLNNINTNHPILTNKKFFPVSINEDTTINLDFTGNLYILTIYQNYILIQLTGELRTPNISVKSVNPETSYITTNVYILKLTSNIIDSIHLLWSYPYELKTSPSIEMINTSTGDMIVTSTVIPDMLFIKDTSFQLLKEGNFFIARFNMNLMRGTPGDLLWLQVITNPIFRSPRFCVHNEDIYIGGTFEQHIIFNNFIEIAEIKTTLLTDIFLAKINSIGEIEWIISSGSLSQGEITLDDITINPVDFINRYPRLLLTGKFNQIIDFSKNNEHLYLESPNQCINMWVGQFDLEGFPIWINCPQSLKKNNYIDCNHIISLNSDIYITGILQGEFYFDSNVLSLEEVVYLLKINSDGDFIWMKTLNIKSPLYNSRNPRIAVTSNGIYLSFFGLGDLSFPNIKDSIKGDGTINLWITALQYNGIFLYPLKIPASIINSSLNITTNKNECYLSGNQIITINDISPFIKKIYIK